MCGFLDVIFCQDGLHFVHVEDVRGLKGLGDIGPPRHVDPVPSAGVLLDKVGEVVELVMYSPVISDSISSSFIC